MDHVKKVDRPILVTIICILGFIGALFVFVGLLAPAVSGPLATQYGPTYLPLTAISTLLTLAAAVGMWMMRKWGVYLYIALTVFGIIYGLAIGITAPTGYIGSIIVTGIGLYSLKKMK